VKKANVGDDVKFDCDSMSSEIKGAPLTTWAFHNSHFLWAPYYQSHESIIIRNVQLPDAGSYSCYGVAQDKEKKLQYFAATISLMVYGKLAAFLVYMHTTITEV